MLGVYRYQWKRRTNGSGLQNAHCRDKPDVVASVGGNYGFHETVAPGALRLLGSVVSGSPIVSMATTKDRRSRHEYSNHER